jgi:hypothetical protein
MALAPPPDLEAITAEVLRLKEAGVGVVERVPLFGSGLHREGEPPYSRQDIADILANFRALSTGDSPPLPVVIGLDHIPGGPAVGRVPALYSEPGGVFSARLADLPLLWARAIRAGLWFRVSAEIEPEPPFGLPGKGCTLVGVSLLGKRRPQLKWSGHLSELVKYAEGRRPARRWFRSEPVPGCRGKYRVYSEAAPMDRKTLLQQLLDAGWPQACVDMLDGLVKDDAELGGLVNAWLANKAGGGDAAAMAAGDAGAAAALTPEQRAAIVDAVLAADPGQDRAALEAMADADLQALASSLGVTYAEKANEGGADVSGKVVTPPAPPPVDAGAVAAEVEKRVAAKFAEQNRRLEQRERAITASLAKRDKAEADRAAEAERADAEEWAKRMRREGKVTPAELDPGPAEAPNFTLVDEVLSHDNTTAVRTYAENGKQVKLTRRDLFKRKVEARTPGKYGEMVPQSPAGPDAERAAQKKAIREWHAARNGKGAAN